MKPFEFRNQQLTDLRQLKFSLAGASVGGCLDLLYLTQPLAHKDLILETVDRYKTEMRTLAEKARQSAEVPDERKMAQDLADYADFLSHQNFSDDPSTVLEQRDQLAPEIARRIAMLTKGIETETINTRFFEGYVDVLKDMYLEKERKLSVYDTQH